MLNYKSLKTKKGRDETGLFIVEGDKFIAEIPPGYKIEQYITSKKYAGDIPPQYTPLAVVRDSILSALSDTVSPQGLIAICHKKQQPDILATGTKFLLCENLNDPGNIGTLIRTAAAAGIDGIILTQGSGDIYNPKVIRASAGAVLRMDFVENAQLEDVVEKLTARNIPIYAAHPRGQNTPYQLDLTDKFCLLVGNETHGISPQAAALATQLVTLPMVNKTESLNASVAGSLLLYEHVRQIS